MHRPNPGSMEPVVYLLQTPMSFRLIAIGGFILFTVLSLTEAAHHGVTALTAGLVLGAALWLESSMGVCRRCRFYGTWHCVGQGMLVSRIFLPAASGLSDGRVYTHAVLAAVYIAYGLFWLWHRPALGLLFTLWLPAALLSAIPPGGFSWRTSRPRPKAA